MLIRLVTLALFVISINAEDLQGRDERDDLLVAVGLLEKQLQDVKQMVAALPKSGTICPYPYKQVVDECFYASKISLSWSAAREYCQGMQGDLATPRNIYGLKSYLLNEHSDVSEFWLGATDQPNEGQWKWLDGRDVDSRGFYPGQPTDDHCLDLRLKWHPSLNDYLCTATEHFVCQFKG